MLICRISDRKQLDGVSLDAQRHQQEQYVARVGLKVVALESFQESAKKSALRSQFHGAIERARRENIRHIVFYVYDRIARNFTDAEILEELVREGALVIHVASGGTVLHQDSDDSEFFLFDINIAQAKQDNRARRRKTIDGMKQRCRNGWYPSRPPTFYFQQPAVDEHGRMKRRGSIVVGPSEEGRRLVRREMELHLKGFSLDRIRQRCLDEGLVPLSLIPVYRRSAIEKRLKQDFYAAIASPHDGFKSQFVWRGEYYEAKHEPIFTADEWARLQASFGKRPLYKKIKHEGLFAQGELTLTCAAPDCGCKVTYAPKKKNGKTYKYYRCADGRRVHRDHGEPQVNVLEHDMLDQLGAAVDAIALTPEIANAIAKGLNEGHREAMAQKARLAETYRAEIRALEEKEDRLFDRYDKGEIDRPTYDRQLERARADKADRFERLRDADADVDSKYLVTADRVLELAKNAKALWEVRNDEEKRDLLAKLVCNPRLDGRTVRFDLQKHFAVLAQVHGEGGWRPRRDSKHFRIEEDLMVAMRLVV